jgi:hypothetical protein
VSVTPYQAAVLKAADANHMWLDAFRCIKPTDTFATQVGHAVLHMLSQPGNLIDCHPQLPGAISQKELVLRINKS